ncbi:MAG: efflux RND transporter periplasmic adaptor subunit, partial [Candidatus Acidiferrum sp.]
MNGTKIAGKMIRRETWTLGIGIALLAAGCTSNDAGSAQRVESVQGIRTQKIQMQTVPDEIEAPGSVIAISTAQVASRAMGTVLQVPVREGDFVKRGQLLA